MLTQAKLKEVLHYNPETGDLTWLKRPANCVKVGEVAGSIDKYGYRCVGIDGKQYKAHRLAVLYMTGSLPSSAVGHIDKNNLNNVWDNLRV